MLIPNKAKTKSPMFSEARILLKFIFTKLKLQMANLQINLQFTRFLIVKAMVILSNTSLIHCKRWWGLFHRKKSKEEGPTPPPPPPPPKYSNLLLHSLIPLGFNSGTTRFSLKEKTFTVNLCIRRTPIFFFFGGGGEKKKKKNLYLRIRCTPD